MGRIPEINIADNSLSARWVMLATGSKSRVCAVYGSTWNRTVAVGLITWKTLTIGNGLVLPPKTRHFMFTILPPTENVTSDCFMTSSVHRLCSFSWASTCHGQMWDRTNIQWVAIENRPCSSEISQYVTAIQSILVWSKIWQRTVKQQLILHNPHTDHVVISSELKYLIGAKFAGTRKWNCVPDTTQAKDCGFMSSPGSNRAKTNQVGFPAGSGTKPNWPGTQHPDCCRITLTHCYHYMWGTIWVKMVWTFRSE